MLVMVLAVSSILVVLLIYDPLKQRIHRRRHRRWHGYFKN
jgi:hypothetical protein